MASSSFRPGTRKRLRLRMAIDGPSGAGKTYTALRCAFALAPGRRVAVIGTEGSASDDAAEKYVGEPDPDAPGQTWAFDLLHLTEFSPTAYTQAIEEAGRQGYEVLLVDSLSHAWEGKDGALELVDRKGGNRFTAWKDVTPMHRRMIEAIQSSPCHVICTMRSKTEYVLEKDDRGKEIPRKVGTAPIQRPGMEYEFDLYMSLDWSHIGTVTKSRCRAVDGLIVAKPGAAFMQPVRQWLNTGAQTSVAVPAARITDDTLARIANALTSLGWKPERTSRELVRRFAVKEAVELNQEQGVGFAKWLESQEKAATKTAANGRHDTQQPVAPTAPTASAQDASKANPTQLSLLGQLRQILFVSTGADPDQQKQLWAGILAKRGVTTARDLTVAQADELIASLKQRTEQLKGGEQAATAAAAKSADTAQ